MDAAYEAGKKLLCGPYSQYTPSMEAQFKKAGRYGTLPIVGAVQFNYIKSKGRTGHVCVVIDCSVDYKRRVFSCTTIEGNASSNTWESNGGMVATKRYSDVPFEDVGNGKDNHISGFGYPFFDSSTCSVKDFTEALKAEYGYIEKKTNTLLGAIDRNATEEEKTQNRGVNNYTKYGKWYGGSGEQWCAQFVSWGAWLACKKSRESSWKKIGTDWYYFIAGVPVENQWLEIDGRWYVFDGAGRMVRGWFKSGDRDWYYLNPDDGAMLSSQWFKDKDGWYYLTASGLMASDTYIYDDERKKYCYVNQNGLWDCKYVDNPGPGFDMDKGRVPV